MNQANLPMVYWINLERSVRRRDAMLKRFAERNIVHERIAGVDGRDNAATAARIASRAKTSFDAACIASHLVAIERAYQDGAKTALVMEDDTTFEPFDAWPDGLSTLCDELPTKYGVVALALAEMPKNLDTLFKHRDLLVPLRKRGYWSLGATLYDRDAMELLLDRYKRGNCFDVTKFEGHHDAYNVIMRTLQRCRRFDGPYVSRIPFFLFEAQDSEIHEHHLWEHRIARDFLLEHYQALIARRYVSPLPSWQRRSQALLARWFGKHRVAAS